MHGEDVLADLLELLVDVLAHGLFLRAEAGGELRRGRLNGRGKVGLDPGTLIFSLQPIGPFLGIFQEQRVVGKRDVSPLGVVPLPELPAGLLALQDAQDDVFA